MRGVQLALAICVAVFLFASCSKSDDTIPTTLDATVEQTTEETTIPHTTSPYGHYETMEDGERVFVYNSFEDFVLDNPDSLDDPEIFVEYFRCLSGDEQIEFVHDHPDFDYSKYFEYDEIEEVIDTPESSVFERIRYDYVGSTLYLYFRNSGYYIYYGVPIEIWFSFSDAESKGEYFNSEIKGYYEYDYEPY